MCKDTKRNCGSLNKTVQEKKDIAKWAEANARLQAVRRNERMSEVSANDKDYFKVIADARLKLDNDRVQVMLCILGSQRGKKPRTCEDLIGANDT